MVRKGSDIRGARTQKLQDRAHIYGVRAGQTQIGKHFYIKHIQQPIAKATVVQVGAAQAEHRSGEVEATGVRRLQRHGSDVEIHQEQCQGEEPSTRSTRNKPHLYHGTGMPHENR